MKVIYAILAATGWLWLVVVVIFLLLRLGPWSAGRKEADHLSSVKNHEK